MGITPGGPTAASFMSYGLARQWTRRPGRAFGTGRPEGIVAPEAADHSAGTCAMLPMLALGVPSSATAAVMMGGLMIWGLQPGPMLFATQPDFVWGLIASMYVSNVVAVILVLATVPLFAALLRIPFAIIGPIIVAICLVGAYTVSSTSFDLWLVLVFGFVGYLLTQLDYPLAPLVLAMVLGHKAENAFHQSMILSDGSLTIFFSNPLVSTIMVLALALMVLPRLMSLRPRRKALAAEHLEGLD
jgi:putative tricarboxylic transport membrane protein